MKYFIVSLMMCILVLYAAFDYQLDVNREHVITNQSLAALVRANDKAAVNSIITEYNDTRLMPDYKVFSWPIVTADYLGNGRISSYKGFRIDPLRANSGGSSIKDHKGVDITGLPGARVQAVAAGVVINKWFDKGYHGGIWYEGHDVYNGYIEILHDNGLTSTYGHVSDILVHEGDIVIMGQDIARISDYVDRFSTGPHLDFRIINSLGSFYNPLRYIEIK